LEALHLKFCFNLYNYFYSNFISFTWQSELGWFTTRRVENKWIQPGSLRGESKILQPDSTHHRLVG